MLRWDSEKVGDWLIARLFGQQQKIRVRQIDYLKKRIQLLSNSFYGSRRWDEVGLFCHFRLFFAQTNTKTHDESTNSEFPKPAVNSGPKLGPSNFNFFSFSFLLFFFSPSLPLSFPLGPAAQFVLGPCERRATDFSRQKGGVCQVLKGSTDSPDPCSNLCIFCRSADNVH